MSDTSQGLGWWLASDGKWYAPEQWTGPPTSRPPGWPAAGPVQTPTPGQITAPAGSPLPAGQALPVDQTWSGQPGQPPAYGANPWPGSVPPGSVSNPYGQPVSAAPGGVRTNSLAIAAFVCSLLGFFFIPFIVGIVLGFVARSQIRNSVGGQKGDGLAIAAIVIGFAWLAFYVLIFTLGAVNNTSSSSVVITQTAAIGSIV